MVSQVDRENGGEVCVVVVIVMEVVVVIEVGVVMLRWRSEIRVW